MTLTKRSADRFVGESVMAALFVLSDKGDQYTITIVIAHLGDADRDIRGSSVRTFSWLADWGNQCAMKAAVTCLEGAVL